MASFRSLPLRRGWALVIVLMVLVLGAYLGRHHIHDIHGQGVATATPGKTDGGDELPAIPVTVASVKLADFPVYLNGIGTVEPYDTVTVRSRVDGEVIKVAFKQGQMVKEGDILVQIDPRPYQAALDQTLAKKDQDEANLQNAQLERLPLDMGHYSYPACRK